MAAQEPVVSCQVHARGGVVGGLQGASGGLFEHGRVQDAPGRDDRGRGLYGGGETAMDNTPVVTLERQWGHHPTTQASPMSLLAVIARKPTLLVRGRLRASRRTCSRLALPVALLVFVVVFIRTGTRPAGPDGRGRQGGPAARHRQGQLALPFHRRAARARRPARAYVRSAPLPDNGGR